MNEVQRKLYDRSGATLTVALLFFIMCAAAGSVILAAATTSTGRLAELQASDQNYYAVVSAAKLSLIHVSLPAPVITFSGILAGANAFLAMLMMGVGFKISGDTSQKGKIVKILTVRYSISIAMAAALYFLMPLPLEYRQVLAILPLSPIASAAPAFTADMKSDFGLASAVNSISIVISIVLITATLLIIL